MGLVLNRALVDRNLFVLQLNPRMGFPASQFQVRLLAGSV